MGSFSRFARGFFAASMLIGVATIGSGCGEQQAAIREVFTEWQKSVTEAKGADAVKLIDSWTIEWYARAARAAANADQYQLEQLDPLMVITVLKMRSEWTKAELLGLTGDKALAAVINKGWLDRSVAGDSPLADVRVDGTAAKAATAAEPKKAAHFFSREAEKWTVTLRNALELASAAHLKQLAESKLTRGQYALREVSKQVPGFDSRLLIGPMSSRPAPKAVEPAVPETVPMMPILPAATPEGSAAPSVPDAAKDKSKTGSADTPKEEPKAAPVESPTEAPLIPKRSPTGSGDPDTPAKDDPDTPAAE